MKILILLITALIYLNSIAMAGYVDTVSMKGCSDMEFIHEKRMLPRGSAYITSSGNLKAQGIKAIIHTAAASSHLKIDPYNPTKESLENSIVNTMILAERFEQKRVAIPFIGGGIFFKGLDTSLNDLADIIVKTAYENSNGVELVFISIDPKQVLAFQSAAKKINSSFISVVKGSITDFKIHHAPVIVNSGNMEMVFGAGISKVIGKATGQAKEINAEAKNMISNMIKP